jgi:hypothetical protein
MLGHRDVVRGRRHDRLVYELVDGHVRRRVHRVPIQQLSDVLLARGEGSPVAWPTHVCEPDIALRARSSSSSAAP